MDQAEKRRQEIAAKKAKLEFLRQQRIERQAATPALPTRTATPPTAEVCSLIAEEKDLLILADTRAGTEAD
jgi:hypothetical protein